MFLQSLTLQELKVPHLKDLTLIYLEPEAQGFGMTFNVCYVGSKYPYFITHRGSFQNRSDEHCTAMMEIKETYRKMLLGFL